MGNMNTKELAQYIKDNGTRLPDSEVVKLAFELADKVVQEKMFEEFELEANEREYDRICKIFDK